MVGQDIGDLLSGEVAKSRANVLDGLVAGREDGNVGGGVDGLNEVGGIEGSTQRGQAGGTECVRGSLGKDQQGVDDVDNTTGEVDVLNTISNLMMADEVSGTYSSSDRRVGQKTTVDGDVSVVRDGLDDLASRHLGEERVGQRGWHEGTGVCDRRRRVGSVQDMVLQKSSEQSRVGSQTRQSLVVDLSKSRVRWCQNGDVGKPGQRFEELRLSSEDTLQDAQVGSRVERRSEIGGGLILAVRKGRKGEDSEVLERHIAEA